MSNLKFELKSLTLITVVGYSINFLSGVIGAFLPDVSYEQLLCYQIGDVAAIMASVIAARYIGLRSQHVAASAFILLGITHGLSLAASGLESFNIEKGITVIMPMIPSMALLCWCTTFPVWLRAAGFIPVVLFIYVYIYVLSGNPYYDLPVKLAYTTWIFIEITWSFYIYKDWKREHLAS
jgi:hypothetical protein